MKPTTLMRKSHLIMRFRHDGLVHTYWVRKTDYKLAKAARTPGTQLRLGLNCRMDPRWGAMPRDVITVDAKTPVSCLHCIARGDAL